MAKKAKKVSWRTIARRAEKAASLPAARRLRAKSAELRRADRATKRKKKAAPAGRGAKAWATRRANALKKAAEQGGLGALLATGMQQPQGINREDSQKWVATRVSPGHGEIVGGADSQLAERLVKLARKKGGTDAVQNEIMALRQAASYEGRVATDRAATNRLIEVQQLIADRVVCGFIAEVDERQRNGLEPSSTFTLSSFTVVKIVDALNKAGYRASGKT